MRPHWGMAVLFLVLGLGEFLMVSMLVALGMVGSWTGDGGREISGGGFGEPLWRGMSASFILGFTMPYFVLGFLAALIPERRCFTFSVWCGHLTPYFSLFFLSGIADIGVVLFLLILTQLMLMAAWVPIYRRFNPLRREFVQPHKTLPTEGQIDIKQKY